MKLKKRNISPINIDPHGLLNAQNVWWCLNIYSRAYDKEINISNDALSVTTIQWINSWTDNLIRVSSVLQIDHSWKCYAIRK